jgi:hypothetical protein
MGEESRIIPEPQGLREDRMIREERWADIHQARTVEHWSVSRIAREFDLDRKTVRGGIDYDLSVAVTVTPRNWTWGPSTATQVPNGTIRNLPNPPVPNGETGYSEGSERFSYSYNTVGAGPNAGFKYVTEVSQTSGGVDKYFKFQIAPDIENTTSEFYRMQCGNWDGATGFISGAQLSTNVREHESGSVRGHYAQYVAAVSQYNIGDEAEQQVAGQGTSLGAFAAEVGRVLQTRANAIGAAIAAEACDQESTRDTACTFRGYMNYAPYQPCR